MTFWRSNHDAAYSEEELYRLFTANAPGSYIDTSHLDIALQKVVELACVEARSVANATYYAFLCEIDKETWVLVTDESDEAERTRRMADAPGRRRTKQRPTSSPRTKTSPSPKRPPQPSHVERTHDHSPRPANAAACHRRAYCCWQERPRTASRAAVWRRDHQRGQPPGVPGHGGGHRRADGVSDGRRSPPPLRHRQPGRGIQPRPLPSSRDAGHCGR